MTFSESMNSFEQVCNDKGLRITHQRSEIFRILASNLTHPTVENIFNKVREDLKTISIDTVYRTIATFEEYGLIKRVQLDNITRYDINLSLHHHFICSNCKKIEDFYWPDFDKMQLPNTIPGWAKVDMKQVIINGLCHQCKKLKK